MFLIDQVVSDWNIPLIRMINTRMLFHCIPLVFHCSWLLSWTTSIFYTIFKLDGALFIDLQLFNNRSTFNFYFQFCIHVFPSYDIEVILSINGIGLFQKCGVRVLLLFVVCVIYTKLWCICLQYIYILFIT